ncbi:unnamed protein product [Closterium sp. NIES-53]
MAASPPTPPSLPPPPNSSSRGRGGAGQRLVLPWLTVATISTPPPTQHPQSQRGRRWRRGVCGGVLLALSMLAVAGVAGCLCGGVLLVIAGVAGGVSAGGVAGGVSAGTVASGVSVGGPTMPFPCPSHPPMRL